MTSRTLTHLTLAAALAVLIPLGLGAQGQPTTKRTLTQVGAGLAWAGSNPMTPGAGVTASVLTFFDPASAEGPYYSLFADTVVAATIDGLSLSDTKVLELGWRPALFGPGLRLDLHLAPTLGARYDSAGLVGSFYTGAAGGLGLWIPLTPTFDLGLSWEGEVNLATWGAPRTDNLSYSSLLVSVASKAVTETRSLPW